MIIAGLHKDPWHDTGAAILRGDSHGMQITALGQERADRIKHSAMFPQEAFDACMQDQNVASIDEIDLVVLDHMYEPRFWREDHHPLKKCRSDVFLGSIPDNKIHIINHHLAHAYAVFYSSPFSRAAILVVDGKGSDYQTQSLFIADGSTIRSIETTREKGVGFLYESITIHIGYKFLDGGKTMGLAPYGADSKKRIYQFPRDYRGIATRHLDCRINDAYPIVNGVPVFDTFEDRARAAYEVQKECESAMIHLATHAKKITGENNLCISGGVGLNSVANQVVRSSGIFEKVYINPATSDHGIPLGCALYGYHEILKCPKIYGAISPYLGPRYSTHRIRASIAAGKGYQVHTDNVIQRAVLLLQENKVVATFQGRSEQGPRALGNRSLLMSPLRVENKDYLNAQVKHRESFRPFAPAVLEESAREYFDILEPSPYMLFVAPVKKEMRSKIPAVTHHDGTARVQTVTRALTPRFYDLIKAFSATTGVPVLLNTSFNVAGEPIVETPEQAVDSFIKNNIDALLIEDTLLIKQTSG